MTAARSSRRAEANLITDAREGASADLSSRQLKYGITMAFRIACFIAMIWVPGPFRWVLLIAAIVLPYIAVLFANQSDQRSNRGTVEPGASDDHALADGEQPRIESSIRLDDGRFTRRFDDIEGETDQTETDQSETDKSGSDRKREPPAE